MISNQSTPYSLARAAQFQASIGYLHCLVHENLLNNKRICLIAFNILLVAAAVITIALSATIALPIFLPIIWSITAIAILAASIFEIKKRYLLQQEALHWKPVFETVLKGNYHHAFKIMRDEIERINQTFSQDLQWADPEITMFARLSIYTEWFKIGLVSYKFFENLEFYIATLKELQPGTTPLEKAEGAIKTYKDIERPALYMHNLNAVKYAIDFINRQTEPFIGTQVNFAKLLFDECLKRLERERVEVEDIRKTDPVYRKNWSHLGDELKQLKRLLAFGKEFLDPKEVTALDDIVSCDTEDEVHIKVRDFLADQSTAVKLCSFPS